MQATNLSSFRSLALPYAVLWFFCARLLFNVFSFSVGVYMCLSASAVWHFFAVLANNRWHLHVVPVSCLPVPHAGLSRMLYFQTNTSKIFLHLFYQNDDMEMANDQLSCLSSMSKDKGCSKHYCFSYLIGFLTENWPFLLMFGSKENWSNLALKVNYEIKIFILV